MAETLSIIPLDCVDEVVEKNRGQLEELLRFDRYRDPQLESPEYWVATLGPDVLSLTHPGLTAAICVRFAYYNETHGLPPLTDEELILFFTTPLGHDWGELKINGQGVGDVSYSLRTQADEAVEAEIFQKIVETVDDPQARLLFERSYHEVAMDRTTKLGKMFHAVEQIGYLQTAMRAYRGWEGQRIVNWRELGGNVLSHQIEKLLALAPTYPYVAHILQTHEAVISQMFADIAREPNIAIDAQGIPMYDREKLLYAQEVWEHKNASVLIYSRDPVIT